MCSAFIKWYLLMFIVLLCSKSHAQEYLCQKSVLDSRYSLVKYESNFGNKKDSSTKKEKKIKNPRTATILSAILPGAGQFYNTKYWKIPIVYAGLAGFSAGIYYNQLGYKNATAAYLAVTDTLTSTVNTTCPEIQSIEGLRTVRTQYRNYRDANIVGITLFYVLQIVDAAVDAHFSGFNPDKPLSLRLNPLPGNGLAMVVKWRF